MSKLAVRPGERRAFAEWQAIRLSNGAERQTLEQFRQLRQIEVSLSEYMTRKYTPKRADTN